MPQRFSRLTQSNSSAVRCFLALIYAVFATAAFAQEGQTVRAIDIQYDGAASVSEERIRANVSTKVGDQFDSAVIEQDIKNLYDSGDVENVRMFTESFSGGIKLIILVKTRGSLGRVSFLGNDAVTDRKLRKETELLIGSGFDDARIEEARLKILEIYQDKGFSDVIVNYSTEQNPGTGLSDLTFQIDEGARTYLNELFFEGNTVFTSEELADGLGTRERKFWRPFRESGRINNRVLSDDIIQVEDRYKDAGYLNAKVVDVRQERVSDEKVNLVLAIDEGPQFSVRDVTVSGVVTFDAIELEGYLQQAPNAIYNGAAVKADLKMLRDYYGAKGYADARATPRLTSAGETVLDIEYMLYEGEKSYVELVNINGNDRTKDKVIRRELTILPGDELNTLKVEESEAKLRGLGYFERVELNLADTGVPGHKDVNITLREKPTGTVNFGAGFSSIDNLVGFIDIVQTNFDIRDWPKFSGGGQKFRMSLKYGTERRDFVMNWTEPWFLDRRLALGLETYYNEYRFLSDQYDQRRIGAAVSLRKPITDDSYLRLENRAQQWEVFRVASEASEEIQSEEGEYFQNLVGLSYVWDTRDDFILPRRGHKFEIGADVSVGDISTYGFNVSGIKYFLLPFDTVFSLDGSVSTIDSYSGDVPLPVRKFLGGANNLRGFDFREVSPKDEFGEPLGGKTAAYATAEVTTPIFSLRKARLAGFFDIGTVSDGFFDFGHVDSNVGFGLRLYTRMGPIRLDYGIPVQSDEFNDSSGQFQFTLGIRY
ncbi:MAG: outer membrane protein assembly factor BamA [Verrucomicrobiota bacterium]